MNANLTLYLLKVLLAWRPNPAGQFLDVCNPAGQFLDVPNPAGQFLEVSDPAGQFLDVSNPAGWFLDVSSFKTLISRKLSVSVKILVNQIFLKFNFTYQDRKLTPIIKNIGKKIGKILQVQKKQLYQNNFFLFQIIWDVEKIGFTGGPNLRRGEGVREESKMHRTSDPK